MKRSVRTILRSVFVGTLLGAAGTALGQTAANPFVPFYGGGSITATPFYPIVGENTHIAVMVGNDGGQAASNVQVRISYNDWGVTFMGWQEAGTVTVPSIAAGGTATAEIDFIFQNRAHTCLEAVIVSADQNGNVNDDRGQINLEVINAGETFSYWVPIVNEGDAPLDLLVVGHCGGRPDGTVQVRCDEKVEEVHLEAGEEILLPIELDLRGVPPGQEVEFVVDAYDLGAADLFAAANHNHVQIRIVRETARHLKESALAGLTVIGQAESDRGLRNRIGEAAKHVELALGDALWVDDNHLSGDGGSGVFAQEHAAVNQLLKLLEADLSLAAKTALNEAVIQLVDADRILAETANRAAGGVAQDALNEGDGLRRGGDYARAIKAYQAAWQLATE